MEKVSRSNVNSAHIRAKDFPKSGFDLTYKSRNDFTLGFLQPCAHQFIMPADKFSGSTDAMYTFNRLVVPQISDVNVSIHSFYVPFRAIDNTFIKGMVPTELNGMSSSWRTPSFTLAGLFNILNNDWSGSSDTLENLFIKIDNDGSILASTIINDYIDVIFDPSYEDRNYLPFVNSWRDYAISVLGSGSLTPSADDYYLILDALLRPLFGKGSLLDMLGYAYLRSYDLKSLANQIFTIVDGGLSLSISNLLSQLPQCEYAIRAYYAIWYEWYRDSFLQKRSSTLPDWRDFGSTSIFTDGYSLICFLWPRVRNWSKDMFVGAMPDDISRHVFAPIYAGTVQVPVSQDIESYMDAEIAAGAIEAGSQGYVNQQSYTLKYIDPTTGTQKSVLCPVPKAVNDALNTISASVSNIDTYGLDLRDLRKAQMLERYLKRNFYFGDEYQDRMLAHYGSSISDNSIRRPHLLDSTPANVNPREEIASVSTSEMPAGTRTATAQDKIQQKSFQFFAEEFGIVISIMSFIPQAQYAPLSPQHLLSQMTDFPLPEFAANNDEFGRVCEIAQSGLKYSQFDIAQFAHYPYAHAWRSRVDEVHGSFLDDKADWTFRRFFGLDSANTTPKLNYKFIACLPNLGMFADTVRLGGQGYYVATNHFFVERVLPTPVEEI